MKTKRSTTRRLGLALACGVITFVASAHATPGGNPGKPPPEAPRSTNDSFNCE